MRACQLAIAHYWLVALLDLIMLAKGEEEADVDVSDEDDEDSDEMVVLGKAVDAGTQKEVEGNVKSASEVIGGAGKSDNFKPSLLGSGHLMSVVLCPEKEACPRFLDLTHYNSTLATVESNHQVLTSFGFNTTGRITAEHSPSRVCTGRIERYCPPGPW
jgi:hypothetical protein